MKENNGNGASEGLQFDEEMCERYIFGELSPADQERFEETYFSDDAFFERYLAVKTELLDLLARGEIDTSKRTRMEPHFRATVPRRKRLEETAMFSQAVTAIARRRTTQTKAFVPKARASEGFAAGLIRLLSQFFMSPRAVAFAALLLVVGGGAYLMFRSPSPEISEEIVLVSEDTRTQRSPETASEQSTNEMVPGTERPPTASLSPERSVSDQSTIVLRTPRRARPTKLQPAAVTNPMTAASPSTVPTKGRASTGFALTLSTVGRDNGVNVGPAPSSPLNIGGQRGRQTQPGEGLTQSLVLRPGATRDGGQTNTLVLRSGVDVTGADLTLLFKGDGYPDYVVTITNMAGKVVLKDNDVQVEKRPDGSNALTLWIDDTSTFKETEKDFIATLQGRTKTGSLETIEEYYFHIRRISTPNITGSQLLAAELSGKVLGPSGEPVAKATVTARNVSTGVTRAMVSQKDGTYQMLQLPPGEYEVYAEAATLKRTVIRDLKLTADNRVELPISLEAGGADAVLNVEGSEITSRRVSITLDPIFAFRSTGARTIALQGDSQHAEFRLLVSNTTHSTYTAVLKTISGKTILSRSLRKGPVLSFTVRSKLLRTGDHVIALTGRSKSGKFEPVAEFYFHVQKHN